MQTAMRSIVTKSLIVHRQSRLWASLGNISRHLQAILGFCEVLESLSRSSFSVSRWAEAGGQVPPAASAVSPVWARNSARFGTLVEKRCADRIRQDHVICQVQGISRDKRHRRVIKGCLSRLFSYHLNEATSDPAWSSMIRPFPWQNCTGWIFPKALVAVYRNSTESLTLSNACHKLNDNEPTALYRLYSIHRSIQCHSVLF